MWTSARLVCWCADQCCFPPSAGIRWSARSQKRPQTHRAPFSCVFRFTPTNVCLFTHNATHKKQFSGSCLREENERNTDVVINPDTPLLAPTPSIEDRSPRSLAPAQRHLGLLLNLSGEIRGLIRICRLWARSLFSWRSKTGAAALASRLRAPFAAGVRFRRRRTNTNPPPSPTRTN